MGKYFNPTSTNAIKKAGGCQLSGATYQELMKQLDYSKCLVGRFNQGLFYVMPLLSNNQEYEAFMRQYIDGGFLSYEFYSMPNSVFGISATSGAAASVTSGTVVSATSGTVVSATSGAAASATSGAAASLTSGTVASATSGTVASTTSDKARYKRIVRINAMMAMNAGLVATCRYCKSEGQSGQKCPKKCGGYCI